MSDQHNDNQEELTPEQIEARDDADFEAGFTGGEPDYDDGANKVDEPSAYDEEFGDDDQGEGAGGGQAADGAEGQGDGQGASYGQGEGAGGQGGGDDQQPADPMAALEERLDKRFRSIEGLMGNFKQQLQHFKDASQAASQAASRSGEGTPTQQQIEVAIGDSDEFKQLEEEFPAWGAAMRKEMEKLAKAVPAGQAPKLTEDQILEQFGPVVDRMVESRLAEAEIHREFGRNWETEMLGNPAFIPWLDAQSEEVQALSEKDSPEAIAGVLREFRKFQDWMADQPEEVRQLRDDVLLDRFMRGDVDSAPSRQEPRRDRSRQAERLRASVPATRSGGGTVREAPRSEDDDFEAGFNSVRRTGG